MPGTNLNTDDSTENVPTYRHTKGVPASVLNACLYALGMQQWLSPNADSEYASEATKICQGLYAAVLISHGQYDQSNRRNSEPDWHQLRTFRTYILDEWFYVPELFHMNDFDTPDNMFDNVEAELVAHGLLHDIPDERTETYAELPDTETPME